MDLQTAYPSAPAFVLPQSLPAGAALRTEGVVLHHLRTPAQVARVLPLRDEIDLSVHAAAGPQSFAALEKKETNWASCSGSSWMGSSSEPSASSRWDTNSR